MCFRHRIVTMDIRIVYAAFILSLSVKISSSKDTPEIRPFAFPQNIRVGEKALLTCHITSGSQPVTFTWLKDGHSLDADGGIRLRTEPEYSLVLLEPVQTSHVGNFTCIAKNRHGFDSYTAVLEVECEHT